MRVLLDECLPERLRDELPGHQVRTAREAGLAGKKNGLLIELPRLSPATIISTNLRQDQKERACTPS